MMNSLESENAIWLITEHYVSELNAGHHPLLRDYFARYPHYASAIADFVAYYQSVELPLTVENAESDSQEYLPLTYESRIVMQRALLKTSLPTPPLLSLLPKDPQTSTLTSLAYDLDLSEDVLVLLDQRMLIEASLPGQLIERLAFVFHQSEQAIRTYLQTSPPPFERRRDGSTQQRHVAEEEYASYALSHSSLPTKTFLQALTESKKATLAQKQFWCEIIQPEEKPMSQEEEDI